MAEIPDGYVAIPAADHDVLKKSHALFAKLWDDPTHGLGVKKATKALDPSIRVPEIDVAEPLLAPIRTELENERSQRTTLEERFAKLEQERDEDKQVAILQRDLDKAQKQYRLTDEAMAEARKLMVDGRASTPEAAAAIIVANIEPARPMTGTNFGPTDANILHINGDAAADDDSTRRLHNDPVRWLDTEVPKIIAELESAEAA